MRFCGTRGRLVRSGRNRRTNLELNVFPSFDSCPTLLRFQGGEDPPSNPQLCGNKRLALGFSDEGFAALKAVSESEDPSIDVASLSKNLLDHQIITGDLKKHPLEQSFLVHILARYLWSV